jgi:hypothetical protein
MKSMNRLLAVSGSTALLTLVGACQTDKSSNPLTPTVAGPIPGVTISAPALISPARNIKLKESEQPVRLVVGNSATSGVRPLTYTFEVATDSAFASKVFSRSNVPPGDNGQTSVQLNPLDLGRTYYWRANAQDGANTGDWGSSAFDIYPRAVLNPPGPISPVNNVVATTTAPTLAVQNSDRAGPIGNVQYEFQVALDQAFTQTAAHGVVSETAGQTTYVAPALTANKTYYWRARASDGETTSGWAVTQVFKTPASGPGPGPGPGPAPGGSCASKDGNFIVSCLGAKYPDKTAAGVSLSQRIANMEFLRDRAIEAGICGGLDLAWNLKRGTGPRSTDALAWRHDGTVDVIDIGTAYDDTSQPLHLQWAIVAGPPGYDPYPKPNCGGV